MVNDTHIHGVNVIGIYEEKNIENTIGVHVEENLESKDGLIQ